MDVFSQDGMRAGQHKLERTGPYRLINTTIMTPGIPVFMPVTITVNDQDYGKIISGYYTAREGKKGILE